MTHASDSWDDSIGAEIYADVVRSGRLYPRLANDLVDLLAPTDGQLLLDLATGTGLVAQAALDRARGLQVVGLDAALAMVDVARREVPTGRASFLVARPDALPLPSASVDLASCSAAFWHFPQPPACLTALARVLRVGGGFAFNVPAAQLIDVEDCMPAPLQVALARAGERRFGDAPQPAGPQRYLHELLELAREAGFAVSEPRIVEVAVPQSELLDLLAVPAIGRRLYPDADDDAIAHWLDEAAARVDLDEEVAVRWVELRMIRSAGRGTRATR